MGKWKVELKLRPRKVAHLATDLMWLLEWQPANSKNDTWYRIRRDNVSFKPNDTFKSQVFIGHIFTALRNNLEVTVNGSYSRSKKRLVLDVEHNGVS